MIIEISLVLASILQLVVCTCFVTFMLMPRFPLRINMALMMVGYVIVLVLGRWLEPLLIPEMIAMNVAFLMVALLLFRDSIWHKVFASMYAVLSASAVDLCAMTICIQVFHMTEYEILTNENIRLVVTYIDYVLVLLLWLIPVTVKMHRKRRFSKATLRNFALYPISHLMALLGFYVILAQWPSRPMALYFAASALVCIFVNVLLLKTMWDTEWKAELERKLQVMEYEKGLQIKEYEALQEKESAVAKLAHDYKNQLAVGLTLLQQEEYDRLAQLMMSLSDSLTAMSDDLDTITCVVLKVIAASDGKESELALRPFGDVAKDAYFYTPVQWALEKQITNGTGAAIFSPKETCTRAHIITFLWRSVGAPEPQGQAPFADVSEGTWYEKATAWAAEQGIVDGASFSPNAPCTREMAVSFLWKQAGSPRGGHFYEFLRCPQGCG